MKEWMNQTWWLYDLTVIAIAVLCIWGGWKRGLLRTVAGLLGYVSAGLLAGLLAQPAAAYVYDRWVEPACTQVVEQQLAKYQMSDSLRGLLSNYGIQLDTGLLEQVASDSNTAADQLYGNLSSQTGVPAELLQSGVLIAVESAATQMDDGSVPSWLPKALKTDSSDVTPKAQNRLARMAAALLSGDEAKAADMLVQEYVQPVTIRLVKIFMFSALFLLISVVLQGIIKGISYLRRVKEIRTSDQIAGAALGAVQMALFLGLMAKLTGWLVTAGNGTLPFFNGDAIAHTILFQRIFRIF